MPPQARVGDTSTHGGTLVPGPAGPSKTMCDGRPIIRVSDILICPLHGPNPVVQGSPTTKSESLPHGRIGDPCACGAAIASGSDKMIVG
jgi:uncharacterized Zn-binding protein involved in type VI secretion